MRFIYLQPDYFFLGYPVFVTPLPKQATKSFKRSVRARLVPLGNFDPSQLLWARQSGVHLESFESTAVQQKTEGPVFLVVVVVVVVVWWRWCFTREKTITTMFSLLFFYGDLGLFKSSKTLENWEVGAAGGFEVVRPTTLVIKNRKTTKKT